MVVKYTEGTVEIHWEQKPAEVLEATASVTALSRNIRHMVRMVFRQDEVELTFRRAPPKTEGRGNPKFATEVKGHLRIRDVLEFQRIFNLEMEKLLANLKPSESE